ncbi:UNKNOWN [Stylonychia lemnae]|uniref:Uncharacterized protein n=1 Tax=Stylonychia lemnae TaxID=5949 RepID=A0A078BBB5_STYLE|nr:UNKNOWN [Stylonychia lemnae]|eukprot:CDW90858.1 UNKNOWN [Stylonychia lemnae]
MRNSNGFNYLRKSSNDVNKTVHTANASKGQDDYQTKKIKINKAFKLNVNNFQDLHTNVIPFNSNYLVQKMRRHENNEKEKKMNENDLRELHIETRDATISSGDHLSQCSPGLMSIEEGIQHLREKYPSSNLTHQIFRNIQKKEENIEKSDQLEIKSSRENNNENEINDKNIQSNFYTVRTVNNHVRDNSVSVTSRRFNFEALENHRTSISQSNMQAIIMDAINTRKNDEEKPIFVVNRKPKSKVVNSPQRNIKRLDLAIIDYDQNKIQKHSSLNTQMMGDQISPKNKIKIVDQNDDHHLIFSQQSSIYHDSNIVSEINLGPRHQNHEIQSISIKNNTLESLSQENKFIFQVNGKDMKKIKEQSVESYIDTSSILMMNSPEQLSINMNPNLEQHMDGTQNYAISPQSLTFDEEGLRIQISKQLNERDNSKLTPSRIVLSKKQFQFIPEVSPQNDYETFKQELNNNSLQQKKTLSNILENNNQIVDQPQNLAQLDISHQSSYESKEGRATRLEVLNTNMITAEVRKINQKILEKSKMRHSSNDRKQQPKKRNQEFQQFQKNISSFEIKLQEDINKDNIHQLILERIHERQNGGFESTVTTQRADKKSQGQLTPAINQISQSFGPKLYWKDKKPLTSNPSARLKPRDFKKESNQHSLSREYPMTRAHSFKFRVKAGYYEGGQNSRTTLANNPPQDLSNQALMNQSRKSSVNSSVVASIERPVVDIKIKDQLDEMEIQESPYKLDETYINNSNKKQCSQFYKISNDNKINGQLNFVMNRLNSGGNSEAQNRNIKFNPHQNLHDERLNSENTKYRGQQNNKIKRGIASPIKKSFAASHKQQMYQERMYISMPTSIQEEQEKIHSSLIQQQLDFEIIGQRANITKITTRPTDENTQIEEQDIQQQE